METKKCNKCKQELNIAFFKVMTKNRLSTVCFYCKEKTLEKLRPKEYLKPIDLKNEIWKDIPGYEGIYQVSNLGRIKSFKILKNNKIIERILKQIKFDGNRYFYVVLNKNKKRELKTIHQLVAISFLNHIPCGYKLIVDHIDNNPLNNNLDNLQIVSQRENASKDKKERNLPTGCSKTKYGYTAYIRYNKKTFCLGTFKNLKEAKNKYLKAKKRIENNKNIKDLISVKKENKTGVKNINKNKSGFYIIISEKGIRKYLGTYKTLQEAKEVLEKHTLTAKN